VVWPALAHVLVGVAVLALIAGLAGAVFFALNSRLYAGLCFVTLIIAVSPYYLPTRYLLDADGVSVHSLLGDRRKPWSSFRAAFPDGRKGVLLSPVAQDGVLARTRGIYLPYQHNEAEVTRFVQKHLPRAAGGSAPRG
jgi:hypothetical protein